MPVNPYDDRKVSLRRPHGNGDLDIVRASYTRRKANVTESLMFHFWDALLYWPSNKRCGMAWGDHRNKKVLHHWALAGFNLFYKQS